MIIGGILVSYIVVMMLFVLSMNIFVIVIDVFCLWQVPDSIREYVP